MDFRDPAAMETNRDDRGQRNEPSSFDCSWLAQAGFSKHDRQSRTGVSGGLEFEPSPLSLGRIEPPPANLPGSARPAIRQGLVPQMHTRNQAGKPAGEITRPAALPASTRHSLGITTSPVSTIVEIAGATAPLVKWAMKILRLLSTHDSLLSTMGIQFAFSSNR